MEINKQYKRVPFDIELAKKIQAGEIEGRIVCNEREFHKILCFDAIGLYPVVALLYDGVDEVAFSFSKNGYFRSSTAIRLFIELPEEAPKHDDVEEVPTGDGSIVFLKHKKHEFKPFDKVLVRNCEHWEWEPAIFSKKDGIMYVTTSGIYWNYCIPYEGNEHLVGTNNKPKED